VGAVGASNGFFLIGRCSGFLIIPIIQREKISTAAHDFSQTDFFNLEVEKSSLKK